MYSLADDVTSRDVAFKLGFMMIMMIFCPVYEVDSAGNPLSPTKAVGFESTVFSVVSGGSCGRIVKSFQVCR